MKYVKPQLAYRKSQPKEHSMIRPNYTGLATSIKDFSSVKEEVLFFRFTVH